MQHLLTHHPSGDLDAEVIAQAAAAIAAGQLIIIPTDTVYGIAADSTNADAIAALFVAKGRPEDRAIPLLAASTDQAKAFADLTNPLVQRLISQWWPGPLTIVVPARYPLPPGVGQNGTVGIRVPNHPVVRALADTLGRPIAATSANRSGEPPATTCVSAIAALHPHITLALDSGPAPMGIASTVVDCTSDQPIILRQGGAAIPTIARNNA